MTNDYTACAIPLALHDRHSTDAKSAAPPTIAVPASIAAVRTGTIDRKRVFIDLTHLGRHVTGIERVSIDQFEAVTFTNADVTYVRARGTLAMIFAQQVWLPILALLNPRATFLFPGFPPSPFFTLIPDRAILFVHDLFLITRRQDLGFKAKAYMAWPFAFAISRFRHFQVNSNKTARDLSAFANSAAQITLYRPMVRNVFALADTGRAARPRIESKLRLVSLGTVEPRKNYAAALTLLDELSQLGVIDVHLDVIGRQGWGQEGAALAADPRVTVHGYLAPHEVKAILETADAYVCTSHDEGLGLPLLEVQYAGLPVIAPDKLVFREVLGSAAVFIDTQRPAQSARSILDALRAADWRATSSAAACANILAWNALADGDANHVLRLFENPLESKSTA